MSATGVRPIPSFRQIESYVSRIHFVGWIFSVTLHLLVIIVLFAPLRIMLRLHRSTLARPKTSESILLSRLQAAPADHIAKKRVSQEAGVVKHRDGAGFRLRKHDAGQKEPRQSLAPHFARDTEQNLPRIMADLGVQIGFGDDVLIKRRFACRFPVWFEVFGPFKYVNADEFYVLELKESDNWNFIRDIKAGGGLEGFKVYALFPKEFGALVHQEIRNVACPPNAVPSVKWVSDPGKYIVVSCVEVH